MRLRFFTIPVHGGAEQEEALNRFLAGHRIVSIDRFMVQDGYNSAWSLCVGFEPAAETRPSLGGRRGAARLDYREILNDTDFAEFARLRALRKELAEAEGVPAYALFTNEQLAEMVLVTGFYRGPDRGAQFAGQFRLGPRHHRPCHRLAAGATAPPSPTHGTCVRRTATGTSPTTATTTSASAVPKLTTGRSPDLNRSSSGVFRKAHRNQRAAGVSVVPVDAGRTLAGRSPSQGGRP